MVSRRKELAERFVVLALLMAEATPTGPCAGLGVDEPRRGAVATEDVTSAVIDLVAGTTRISRGSECHAGHRAYHPAWM